MDSSNSWWFVHLLGNCKVVALLSLVCPVPHWACNVIPNHIVFSIGCIALTPLYYSDCSLVEPYRIHPCRLALITLYVVSNCDLEDLGFDFVWWCHILFSTIQSTSATLFCTVHKWPPTSHSLSPLLSHTWICFRAAFTIHWQSSNCLPLHVCLHHIFTSMTNTVSRLCAY